MKSITIITPSHEELIVLDKPTQLRTLRAFTHPWTPDKYAIFADGGEVTVEHMLSPAAYIVKVVRRKEFPLTEPPLTTSSRKVRWKTALEKERILQELQKKLQHFKFEC